VNLVITNGSKQPIQLGVVNGKGNAEFNYDINITRQYNQPVERTDYGLRPRWRGHAGPSIQRTINRFAPWTRLQRLVLAQQDFRREQFRGISSAGPGEAGRRKTDGPVEHDQDRRAVGSGTACCMGSPVAPQSPLYDYPQRVYRGLIRTIQLRAVSTESLARLTRLKTSNGRVACGK
jgi:hypothetical protein